MRLFSHVTVIGHFTFVAIKVKTYEINYYPHVGAIIVVVEFRLMLFLIVSAMILYEPDFKKKPEFMF